MTAGEAARKLLVLWRPAMPTIEVGPPSLVQTLQPPPPPGLVSLNELERRMKSKEIPLTWPGTGYILVWKENAHMRAPKPVGEYWVETHASAFYLVKTVNYVLKVLDEDPARVHAVLP